MKRYYVAVCVPQESGGWRAIFPDVPGCEVESSSLEGTVFHARTVLVNYAASLNGEAHEILPLSRDLTDIRSEEQRKTANAIDWPGAVITMIPLSV